MQHAVEILVLSKGPNSTKSGISSAEVNNIVTGPNLNSVPESLPNEANSHKAPVEIKAI